MAAAIVIQAGYKTDVSQRLLRILGTLVITGTPYPVGGIALDSVILALPEAITNSGVQRCVCTSLTGTGYLYQRQSNGKLMILQLPPNGSLTTAAPMQQLASNTNMQGVNNDVIDFEAEIVRG
jgi:hypothetical protein